MMNLFLSWSRKFWLWLTEPAASVQDPEDRQNVRWLAALFVTLLPFGLLLAVVPSLMGMDVPLWQDNDFLIILVGMALWTVAYLAIRVGHYRWAVGLSVASASIAIFAIVITDNDLEDIHYLLIPLLLTCLILPLRVTILLAIADILGMLLLPLLKPGIALDLLIVGPISQFAIGCTLIMLVTRHRNRLESSRQAELQESEERLQSIIGQSVDGLILVENGMVTVWNQGMENITQVPALEIIGRPIWRAFELLAPEQYAKTSDYQRHIAQLKLLTKSLSHTDSWFNRFIEFEVVLPDGNTRSIQMLLFPIQRKAAVSVGTIVRDITEKKRLDDALKYRNRELALLHRAGQALTSRLGVSEVLDVTLEETRRLLDIVACSIWLVDSVSRELVCRQVTGPKRKVVRGWRLKPGQGIAGWVFDNQKGIIVPDVLADPRYFPGVAKETEILMRSIIGVPLMAGGEVMGVLEAVAAEPERFTRSDLELVESLAASAAIAIQNARLFERTQKQLVGLEALNRINAQLASSLHLPNVLDEIVQSAVDLVGASGATIFLYDAISEEFAFGSASWVDERMEASGKEMLPGSLVDAVAHKRSAIVINDVPNHELLDDPIVQERNLRAVAGFPLIKADRMFGVFAVAFTQPHQFNDDELHMLGSLAYHAAVAIENAQLVEGLEAEVHSRTSEILAEKEKGETILKSVGDAVTMSDLEFRIQYANDAFLAQTGFTADEVLGEHAHKIGAIVKSDLERQSLKATLLSRKVWRGEAIGRRKDGRTYEAYLTVAPVLDEDGNLDGYVSTHRDISQQKELDQARSRFTTNVSHQLRTPVTNIKLYTHLLGQKVSEEKRRRYLQVLGAQTTRLERLVQDLIEVTVLDSGDILGSWHPVAISNLVNDVIARFESRAQKAGLKLVATEIPAELPKVKGDQARLIQVLEEIVENALAFTTAGGQITIETGTAEDEGETWVTITVRDTGPGITSDDIDQIFDRFFRGQLAESGHIPGTGLGLSIAQEIMLAHGGRLTVQSQEGKGSSFTLWLKTFL